MKTFLIIVLITFTLFSCNNSSLENKKGGYKETATQSDTVVKQLPGDSAKAAVSNDSSSTDIVIYEPLANAWVQSPITIKGRAKGSWFFEGSFPVELYDEKNRIAQGVAKADSNWMTEQFVPFSLTLPFGDPATAKGKLVFKKDNPSGLKENAASHTLPVNFSSH